MYHAPDYHARERTRPIIQTREAASAGRGALVLPASAQDRQASLRGETAPTQAEFYRLVIIVMLLSMASVGAGVLVGLLSAFLRA